MVVDLFTLADRAASSGEEVARVALVLRQVVRDAEVSEEDVECGVHGRAVPVRDEVQIHVDHSADGDHTGLLVAVDDADLQRQGGIVGALIGGLEVQQRMFEFVIGTYVG